ncbi:MAG: dockerin type I domain-containing protein, partial [Clostridiales bacterium]|nr:dockerin type I domain-containing protein [Clostridiales bacterium]
MKKRILLYLLISLVIAALFSGHASIADSTVLGDVDLDGKVTAQDASYILRYLVDQIKLNEQQLINADVNGDGKVTAQDAAAILRYLVQLDDLPPSGVTITHGPTIFRTPTPTPSPTVNPDIGDANCDGRVTAQDAAAILRHLVQIQFLTPKGLVNADANRDGKVTAADAAAILRFLVDLDELPPRPVTPTPIRAATPIPTPVPTPIPTNRYKGPAAGEEGLIVHDSDPNIDKIYRLYLYRELWNGAPPGKLSEKLSARNEASQYTIGWCYMTFMGAQNGGSPNYSPNIRANTRYTIDEPILQRTGPYYLNVDIKDGKADDGSKSTLVSIHGNKTKNIVITGHNSRSSRTHFHHLHSLQNGAKFYHNNKTLKASDYAYPNIIISMFGLYKWQVWSV